MIKTNEIEEVIRKYNNGQPVDHKLLVVSDDDPDLFEKDYEDGTAEMYIVHHSEEDGIEVVFAEHSHIKAIRDAYHLEEDEDKTKELEEELLYRVRGELADQFNYDQIVGYRVEGGNVVWI